MPELRLEQTPTQTQEQKQSHRLIVSQKHQQAIELLQYPVQELSQWINEQLQENPLLEINRESPDDIDPELEDEVDDEMDIDWEELANRGEDYHVNYRGGGSSNGEHPEDKFRAVATQHETLHDSLKWQLNLLSLTEAEKKRGELLISYINSDGLFTGDIDQIAEEHDVDPDKLEKILGYIQEFEPAGVGGRDLSEVMLIQLEQNGDVVPNVAPDIIDDHLEDLQNRYFSKIADSVGCDKETVQEVADIAHELEPRPGRVHEPVNRQYLTPDVRIREVDGEYAILINEEAPPLSISAEYRAMLQSEDDEIREYVKDKLKGALWIIQCIHQRHDTLHRVTRSIVEHQKEFFENGIQCLKPLVLKDVAEDIDVHQSTVSRTVQNKYVQTDRGLYPLNFFFSSSLETEGDMDSVSSTAIKAKIKEIIESEDKTDPLSDRSIKELLNEDGIKIGRRTISKYRKQLLIPPWKLRKRVVDERTE